MRLLLIEDDELLSQFIAAGLHQAGYESDCAFTADEALALVRTQSYDLIITDLGLPDQDGLTLLKKIREHNKNIPVLILTARQGVDDKVKGLDLGADDYLPKPFEMPELTARVRALLRRPAQALDAVITVGNLALDTNAHTASVINSPMKLTRREIDLLEQLMRNNGKVVSKELIESRLYSYGEQGSSNSIEVLVHRLRKKLDDAGADVQIATLRGLGYVLAERTEE
ncbi:response regulator transcription factor [Micavibrio aeruginosavorus]|uniref:DNA-binding response regulator n=1 Tax=Micavibrio aeruginosavorus EPB TaxID=349215 RepID=M4VDZ0_9BACT|nr:response regulator transcription factor [Micavibrio aeruginosavorus]AGH97433.1 DNA-binding response regulator [Micavibrio aeruginosavorus EPB]